MDQAVVLKSHIFESLVLRVRDDSLVGTFGDPQTMDRISGGLGKGGIDFLSRGVGRYLEFLGKLANSLS